MISKKEIFQQLVRETHAKFIYVTDESFHGVREDWRFPELDENGFLRGDCDDFALHILKEGRDRGLNIRLVYCRIPVKGGYGDHLVAYEDDLKLVADNNHNSPFTVDWVSGWKWERMSQINQVHGKWYKVRL